MESKGFLRVTYFHHINAWPYVLMTFTIIGMLWVLPRHL